MKNRNKKSKLIILKENINHEINFVVKNNKAINHITKKKWGYYLTDSCNYTLIKNGFKTAIVVSQLSKKKSCYQFFFQNFARKMGTTITSYIIYKVKSRT